MVLTMTRPDASRTSLPEVSPQLIRRAAELDALVWAVTYRKIRGESFTVIPPLVDVYRDQSQEVVVTKAAQVFVSEYCINLAFWVADTRQGKRGNVLYVFPAKEQVGDFSRARVDTAVEESAYLQGRVQPEKGIHPIGKPTDNVGLKRVGNGYIYFRGSNAEAGLISVDADLVIYDEVDRLKPATMSLGKKRLGSSLLGWQRYVSTPKYPETGVDLLWLRSDRRRYHLRCEHCGERQPLSFPDNVREDGEVICRRCHGGLNRLAPGEWVPENPGAELRGYHMTKLLSPRADIRALARLGYAIGRRDVTDPSEIQEFWNQDLGLPHAPEGGQLSRAEIEACRAEYSLDEWAPRGCTMGVDIGAKLHVRVNAPGPEGKIRAVFIGTVLSFEELDGLMAQYDVSCCVVDAEPEHHSARNFANRFAGRVWLCHYPNTATWPHQEAAVWDEEERTVSAHRTLTLDATFARVRERRIEYPREVLALPEFAEHMMAPIRVIEKDKAGNLVAKYVEGSRPDHYAHAENYAYIAELRPGLPIVTPSMFTIRPGRRQ
jgi:hypothetical protein